MTSEQEFRNHLARLARRGRRDGRGGALSFFPVEQPSNRTVEYATWYRAYVHVRNLRSRG